jgi:hypothetical protein
MAKQPFLLADIGEGIAEVSHSLGVAQLQVSSKMDRRVPDMACCCCFLSPPSPSTPPSPSPSCL